MSPAERNDIRRRVRIVNTIAEERLMAAYMKRNAPPFTHVVVLDSPRLLEDDREQCVVAVMYGVEQYAREQAERRGGKVYTIDELIRALA